jgi:hypothetical protein
MRVCVREHVPKCVCFRFMQAKECLQNEYDWSKYARIYMYIYMHARARAHPDISDSYKTYMHTT